MQSSKSLTRGFLRATSKLHCRGKETESEPNLGRLLAGMANNFCYILSHKLFYVYFHLFTVFERLLLTTLSRSFSTLRIVNSERSIVSKFQPRAQNFSEHEELTNNMHGQAVNQEYFIRDHEFFVKTDGNKKNS